MRILALSTASPALSLALFEDDVLVGHSHDVIGRGHAERTLPAIVALLGDRQADAIIVDIGPGSFTGIRIGIAAARALGLAWGVPVSGCSASALVAAQAFAAQPALAMVNVCLDVGRGQRLQQQVSRHYDVSAPIIMPAGTPLPAGACAGPMAGSAAVHQDQPDVRFALDLPRTARAHSPQAIYVRPPDAILPL